MKSQKQVLFYFQKPCYTEEKQNIERKQNMVILGVDLGKARTGVAVCDKSELLASPVEVVNEHNRDPT